MELQFEGILETLLVGAIVSLLVLSVLFFCMGHVLRMDAVRRFFKFLVYEEEVQEVPSAIASAPSRIVRRDKGAPPRTVPSHFVLVLLIALLYGAGVIVESWSHTDQEGHDSEMKLKSFDAVAHGRLASGADPEPRLAQFLADYDACHRTHINTAVTGTRNLDQLEAARVKGADLSPCSQIDVRVLEFYHNAKNAVLQQDSFNKELSNLQSRINFIRSVYVILVWLTWELAAISVIAGIAEILFQRNRARKSPRLERLYLRCPTVVQEFFKHLQKLAAVRCVLMFAGLLLFRFGTYKACDECESQFDKRVYGYFLSLGDNRDSSGASHDLEKANVAETQTGARSQQRGRDITPRSPYVVFKTAGTTPGEHLAPSAVRKMGDGSRVIVANDIDKGAQQMFWLFDVEGADRLVNPQRVCTNDGSGSTADFGAVPNAEAIYVGDPGPDGLVEVLVAPTFERMEQQDLVRFFINPKRGSSWDKELGCQHIEGRAERIPIEDPCAVLLDRSAPAEKVVCRIEGITSADIKKYLLVGVHDASVSPAKGAEHAVMKPTVAIVRMVPKGGGWGDPQLIFKDVALADGCRSQSGISDLSARPNGLLYVLTSVDLQDARTCSDHDKPPLPEVAQVRGALWRLDMNHFPGELQLLYKFAHKPEGITDLGDGSLLVVFNDDGPRKSPIWAPRTFALEQNEAVFTVLPAAGEGRQPPPAPAVSGLLSSASNAP